MSEPDQAGVIVADPSLSQYVPQKAVPALPNDYGVPFEGIRCSGSGDQWCTVPYSASCSVKSIEGTTCPLDK